jgi:hypothetical protein
VPFSHGHHFGGLVWLAVLFGLTLLDYAFRTPSGIS